MENNIKIDIIKLLKFYDEKNDDKKPVSSITGIIGEDLLAGLFKHYLENQYISVKIFDKSIKSEGKRCKMLDRWIIQSNNNEVIAFQTEIKNWSAHSLGGESLPQLDINNPYEGVLECAKKNFEKTWRNDENEKRKGGFIDDKVGKVLKLMKNDEVTKNAVIVPLVCFWMPICDEDVEFVDNLIPFFEKECSTNIEINPFVNDGKFDKVYFFSASIYLRSILKNNSSEKYIDIWSSNIQSRINILNELIVDF